MCIFLLSFSLQTASHQLDYCRMFIMIVYVHVSCTCRHSRTLIGHDVLPYNGNLLREKTFANWWKNGIFTEKTFMDCLLVPLTCTVH